jgi:hypothetical protein
VWDGAGCTQVTRVWLGLVQLPVAQLPLVGVGSNWMISGGLVAYTMWSGCERSMVEALRLPSYQ